MYLLCNPRYYCNFVAKVKVCTIYSAIDMQKHVFISAPQKGILTEYKV